MTVKIVSGLVSVVIPTYNQIEFVRETFDSVLVQDYPWVEIIISDDGSVDGTAEVIKEYAARYPEKIVPILSDKNTGIAANFNRGLNKVRGEYIAWLGGDDLMFPEKIRKQVELLQQRPDAVGCCHDAEVFESPSGRVLGFFSQLMNGTRGFREGGVELWFDANYFMLPSTVMIRSKAVPVHGFDERLKYANDWLLDIEIFRQGKCVVINEVLGKYRRHANNVTGDAQARKQGNEDGMIALCIVDARYPELHKHVRKRRVIFFLAAATWAFRDGDLKKSRGYLKIAIRQGALMRGVALFAGLSLFGPYVMKQTALLPYQRSSFFIKLSKYIKG
jgi:glycosyltransferase involved in cell wall biosynthesis